MITTENTGRTCFECTKEIYGTCLIYYSADRRQEVALHSFCALSMAGKLQRMIRNHIRRLETITEGVH